MTSATVHDLALARAGCSGGLREREDSLALLRDLLVQTGTGTGGTAVIRGGTGTGRTALLDAVVREERSHGTVVLNARSSEQESNVPFGVALQLFETALQGQPTPLVPLTGIEQWDGSLHGIDLPSRLWRLLRSKAAAGPVLLAVDDVHLADPPSRRWLAQVARRLERLPVLLVVTERWQYDLSPQAPGFADVLGQSAAETCTLRPLSPPTCAALVRAALGDGAAHGLAQDCFRATGGNPLLLRALLADLRETTAGAALTQLPSACTDLYPGGYTGAVARWLRSAGPRTAAAARALAELQDEEGALALVAETTGVDPARLPGWTAELARQGMLGDGGSDGRWTFRHPLLRDAVRASGDRHQRVAVRRRVAELLHHRGDPEDAVARHLLVIPAVGATWAADALIASAGFAVRAARPEEAEACLRRALEEPLPADRRSAVLGELGCLEARAGRAGGARHLAQALRLERSPGGKVRVATALGTALAGRGEVHAALDVLRELSGSCADSTEPAHALQAATALIAAHDSDSWLRVVAELKSAEERSPDGVAPTVHALLTEHAAAAGLLSADQVMERVRSWTAVPLDPLLEPYLLASAAGLAQCADQWQEADRLVARGLAAGQPRLLHPGHQRLADVRARGQVLRGRYDALLTDATLLTDTELLRAPRTDGIRPRPGTVHLHAQALIALTETGRLTEARCLADALGAGGPYESWEWNEFLYARGLLLAASGDPRGALRSLLECGRRQSAREVESPVVTPWRSAAADCHVALGAPELAVPLAAEELRLAQVWGTPRTTGRAMRALAVSLGGRRGLELAEQAVDVLRGSAQPLPELVPALVSLGKALHGAGRYQRARTVLREAAQAAERLRAARPRATVSRTLDEYGARPPRPEHTGGGALTAGELRVARMAASGHGNGEIAALLHIAVRTVETHLTHCYRKLGIRGRADLATALDERR
ncbi:AAA family ATPase [Streptomyces rubellomurinus]|uniref:AAA family ATPase n=1 Tax=Streptomyces rubellomurinus (strain ATCC 31215) TaxID=359131 RepID=UPI00099D8ADD|nr:LuxR family transcriptional regulator [Streptomyces rubellomurinus]